MKNEEILNTKKQKIMEEIARKNKLVGICLQEKKILNEQIKEENIVKQIERQEKVKQIEKMQEYQRNIEREILNEKSKKIQEFMDNKVKLNQYKKEVNDNIAMQKSIYNEQLQAILGSKTINENTLDSIKSMFPSNEKINNLIDEFKQLNTINLSNNKNVNRMYTIFSRRLTSKSNKILTLNGEEFNDCSSKTRQIFFKKNNNYLDNEFKTESNNIKLKRNLQGLEKSSTKPKFNVGSTVDLTYGSGESNCYNNIYPINKNKSASRFMDSKYNSSSNNNDCINIRDYKIKINKEFLEILSQKKKNENLRELELEKYSKNDPKRIELEKEFGKERAKDQEFIQMKNNEIKKKLIEYENQLLETNSTGF